jgi:hypothetical protein
MARPQVGARQKRPLFGEDGAGTSVLQPSSHGTAAPRPNNSVQETL